jgi:hypothetical protein
MLPYLYLADSLEDTQKDTNPDSKAPWPAVHYLFRKVIIHNLFTRILFSLLTRFFAKAECLQEYDQGVSYRLSQWFDVILMLQ